MSDRDGSKKLHKLNLDNALERLMWKDFPYDKGLLEKKIETLKKIIGIVKAKNVIDDEISDFVNELIDDISEIAVHFMDLAHEKSPFKIYNFPSDGYNYNAEINQATHAELDQTVDLYEGQ